MGAFSIDVAVTMLDTWPCCLDLIDLSSQFTLGIAIAMNGGNLEIFEQ